MTADQVRKLLRRKQGKGTQKELAEKIGITPAYLSDIYSGNRRPAKRVLDFLGMKEKRVYE